MQVLSSPGRPGSGIPARRDAVFFFQGPFLILLAVVVDQRVSVLNLGGTWDEALDLFVGPERGRGGGRAAAAVSHGAGNLWPRRFFGTQLATATVRKGPVWGGAERTEMTGEERIAGVAAGGDLACFGWLTASGSDIG